VREVGGEAGRRVRGKAWSAGKLCSVAKLLVPLILLSSASSIATAHGAYPATRLPASPPESLTVYLMTMGPGKRVWERFGHNAIWIHDPVAGTDQAYNYGLFDFRQQHFLLRFIQGRMWYWMQGFPAQSYVESYRRANRSVWVQELEMTPQARLELQQFLEWNERPENRFYHYDYYRDNCSTRVRDALDRALGGRIHEVTASLPTGKTYRFHTLRLTANDPPIYTGLLLALGQPVDRPISAWEEMFLPLAMREHLRKVTVTGADGARLPLVRSEGTLFESTDPAPPAEPPFWLPYYLIAGLGIGGAAFGLGSLARTNRSARIGFMVLVCAWTLLVGTAGLILAGLWGLTDHAAAYNNENILQANPLALPLLWLVPRLVFGSRSAARLSLGLAGIVGALSVVALLLKLFPAFYQVNGAVIALALPIHAGVAGGLRQLTRGQDPRTRRSPSLASG
jgi:uncharacterized protein DUF4105